MRLCIPTIDERGLAARVSPHFGSAPYLTIVDVSTGGVEVHVNAHAGHEHGQCRPAAALEGHAVDAVLCGGLGRGALAVLLEAGYGVFLTVEADVAHAIHAYRSGRVEAASADGLSDGSAHPH